MQSNDFLFMLDTAIKYFDPNESENESARRILEVVNETHKIGIDRLDKQIEATQMAIKVIKAENSSLEGSLSFTDTKIKELTKDNCDKTYQIKHLTELLETRKKYLEEVQNKLSSYRRQETNKTIAEKRALLKSTSQIIKSSKVANSIHSARIRSDDLKVLVDDTEEKLEQSVIKISKLTQDIRNKNDYINKMKFRLSIEKNDQQRLYNQYQKISEEIQPKVSVLPPSQLKRPMTGTIRNKAVFR